VVTTQGAASMVDHTPAATIGTAGSRWGNALTEARGGFVEFWKGRLAAMALAGRKKLNSPGVADVFAGVGFETFCGRSTWLRPVFHPERT
jgi:hypothetical protein